MGSLNPAIELDALVIGAGFGGVYQLKKLRDLGFSVKLVESGTNYGGVWYWNRYPGARVDSPIPHYEFSDPALWRDWLWKQRFPGSAELRAYFSQVADTWDLRKDTIFESYVDSVTWQEAESRWLITTRNGLTFKARFFLANTGFAAKRYMPDWKGIDTFQGTWIHPSFWPQEEPDLRGKKIAVIGTGSTGVQLVQDLAPFASELVLFQRTPNLALPMKQVDYQGDKIQALDKERYEGLFRGRVQSFSGFDYNFMSTMTFDHSKEERLVVYESLWDHGDFHFWLATYGDMLFSDEANTEAYNFWRDKTRPRINDERLKEKLAPMIKPHAFGCKRISLENGYFELFNQQHTHLVDLNDTPVVEVTPKGIKTSEKEWNFDFVVCATGFDAITGGLMDMNLVGRNAVKLKDYWSDGIKTNMGICVPNFPNMFFTYGPQAPTALCNGPSCAELQGDWIISLMDYMRKHELTSADASEEQAQKWAKGVWTAANMSLLPTTKSWYMGDNIPGKTREPLIYLGGVPNYYKFLCNCSKAEYPGFTFA